MSRKRSAPALAALGLAGALAFASPLQSRAATADAPSSAGGSTDVTVIAAEQPEPDTKEPEGLPQTGVSNSSGFTVAIALGSATAVALLRPRSHLR